MANRQRRQRTPAGNGVIYDECRELFAAGLLAMDILIRDALESDFRTIVDINAREVQHTSRMDLKRLKQLDQLSTIHLVTEIGSDTAAFLLAMRENCPYPNDNYAWFASRFTKFLYIDRIVVDARYHGLGVGSLLYERLFDYARTNGVATITCEYNITPPNETSRLFHDKFGFEELGTQWLDNGSRLVSLQVADA